MRRLTADWLTPIASALNAKVQHGVQAEADRAGQHAQAATNPNETIA